MSVTLPKKPHRPWYRPHVSTWVVMVLALAGMTFWNVAGYYEDSGPGSGDEFWAHGWPVTYLQRHLYRNPGLFLHPEPKSYGSATWRLWEGINQFHKLALTMDVVAAILVVTAVGGAFECWRRMRIRVHQIYLGELLLAVLVLSAVLAAARYSFQAVAGHEQALREINNKFALETAHGTPEILRQYLPGINYKLGDRVIAASNHYDVLKGEDLRALASLPFVQRLKLCRAPGIAGQMHSLAGCCRLEEMELWEVAMADADWDALCRIPRLRKLSLWLRNLTDDRLRDVARIQCLEELSISGPQLRGTGLGHLATLRNLRSLEVSLGEAPPGSTRLAPVANLRQLHRLSLFDQNWRVLTTREVEALAELTELEELTIRGYEFENDNDAARLIERHPKFKSLSLDMDRIPERAFAQLRELRWLEDLTLRCENLGAVEAAHIAEIRWLRRLSLPRSESSHFDDRCLARLELLLYLEALSIPGADITDSAVDSIIAMRSLRYLNVIDCRNLSSAGLARLAASRPDIELVSRSGPYWWDY